MALVVCKECSKSVSSRAIICPSCGNPLGGALEGPILVERTPKIWKKFMLATGAIFIFGLILAAPTFSMFPPYVRTSPTTEVIPLVGRIVMMFGGAGFIAAKIAAWWETG